MTDRCACFSRKFRLRGDGKYEETTSEKAVHTMAKAALDVSLQIIDPLSDVYFGYLIAYRKHI